MKKISYIAFVFIGSLTLFANSAQAACTQDQYSSPTKKYFNASCTGDNPFRRLHIDKVGATYTTRWYGPTTDVVENFKVGSNVLRVFLADDPYNNIVDLVMGVGAVIVGVPFYNYSDRMTVSAYLQANYDFPLGPISSGNPHLWIRDDFNNNLASIVYGSYFNESYFIGTAHIVFDSPRTSTFTVGDEFGVLGTFKYIVDPGPPGGVCGAADGQVLSTQPTGAALCSSGSSSSMTTLPVCDVFESMWNTDGGVNCGEFDATYEYAPPECYSCRTTLSGNPGWGWSCVSNGVATSCAAEANPIGTVNVSANIPGASWTITGPATITGSGTSQSTPAQPAGTYTITWSPVSSYTTPPTEAITLLSGGAITFNGTYTVAAAAPVVSTSAVTSVTSTGASSGGTISSNGGAAVLVSGIVLGTSANPTTALPTKTTDGWAVGGPWTDTISGLTPNTTYHVRAYATNSVGTGYGSDILFATTAAACTGLPTNALGYPAPDNTGLLADTSYVYAPVDTAAKCEYGCSPGYMWDAGTNTCILSLPPSLSCSPNPSAAVLFAPVSITYTAIPIDGAAAPYTFRDGNGALLQSGSSLTLTKQYTDAGNYSVTVSASNVPIPKSCGAVLVKNSCGLLDATLTATPTRLYAGQSSTIVWEASTGVSASCVVTGPNGYTKTIPASACGIATGEETIQVDTKSTYCMTCDGNDAGKICVSVNTVPKFWVF